MTKLQKKNWNFLFLKSHSRKQKELPEWKTYMYSMYFVNLRPPLCDIIFFLNSADKEKHRKGINLNFLLLKFQYRKTKKLAERNTNMYYLYYINLKRKRCQMCMKLILLNSLDRENCRNKFEISLA